MKKDYKDIAKYGCLLPSYSWSQTEINIFGKSNFFLYSIHNQKKKNKLNSVKVDGQI